MDHVEPVSQEVPAAPKKTVCVRVYVICLPNSFPKPGQRNTRILGVKLNRASAQKLVDQYVGAYIEKQNADKL